jgi:hypothetical protein
MRFSAAITYAHSVAAAEYVLVEERLARRAPADPDAYYEIKDPVFDIMAGANEWAARTARSELPAD